MPIKLFYLLSFLFLTLFYGCDKIHARKYAGKYNCEVEYTYESITPTHIDSAYNINLEITRDGKY